MQMRKIIKSVLAYTLTLAILLSTLVFGAVSVTAEDTEIAVWSGNAADSFAGGDGTAANPYKIENADQLFKVVEEYDTYAASYADNGQIHFILTEDIYINDVSDGTFVGNLPEKRNWLEKFGDTINNPSTDRAYTFNGCLDGDGHTIYGLYVNGVARAGLFPGISNKAIIKNLKIENACIKGGDGYAGAVVGLARWLNAAGTSTPAQITNVGVTNLTISGVGFAGGLVGNTTDATLTISNCYTNNISLSNWEGSGTPGGLVGADDSGGALKINNSYSAGYFPMNSLENAAVCTNVYTNVAYPEGNTTATVTVLTDDKMKGENAKVNMALDYRWVYKVQGDSFPTFQDGIIDVWDGTNTIESLDAFEGSGSADDPYQIENGNQLAYVVATDLTDGLCFKLTKDIRLNDTSTANWKDTAKNWVWKDVRFVGTFDGDGHTIDGLFYNKASSTEYRVGLFLYVGANGGHSCTIKNFKMTNAYIANNSTKADAAAGVIAGQASQVTTFENIYIDETCEVNSPAADAAGGLLGKTDYNINITNCAALAKVTGETYIGAFVGWMKSNGRPTIVKSYTTTDAPVTGNLNTDKNFLGTASADVYAIKKQGTVDAVVTELTLDKMKGEAAKTYMPGLSYRFYWEITDGYPVVNVRDGDLWDGTYGTSYEIFNNKGDGSKENPYLIENGAQLAFAVSYNRSLNDGSYYKLANDIILNDTEVTNWEATAKPWIWNNHLRFNGTLDGDGHTIEGLYMSTDSVNGRCALIAYIGKDSSKDPNKVAEVKNITFKSASINSTATATNEKLQGYAVVAGQTSGETLFENLYIDENCTVNGPYVKGVAGIIGRGYDNNKGGIATIRNCAVLATINGGSLPGAFVGTYYANDAHITVENSYADTNVGLFGNATKATVTNTYTTVLGSADTGATQLDAANMKGENAKTYMPGLDYDFLWKTVQNDYPVLRDMDDRLEAWDGTAATTLEGEGTKANPYKISNGAELYYAISNFSTQKYTVPSQNMPYFEITSSINLNNVQWYNVGKDAYPQASNYPTGFAGVIYGNGHTIYNLASTVNVGTAGLIPVATQGTEIYDLHLKNGNLPKVDWDNYAAGGLIGLAVGTQSSTPIIIDGCSVENYTVASRDASAAFVGSVYSQSLVIKECYAVNNNLSHTSEKEVMNSSAFAAVHGQGNGSGNSITIEGCYTDTNAKVSFEKEIAISYNNVYTTDENYDGSIAGINKVSADSIIGSGAETALAGLNFNQKWTIEEGKAPVHTALDYRTKYFTGKADKNFAGGTGTVADPYLISTADQLYSIATSDRAETLGKYYKLTNNITISNIYSGWTNDNPYNWAVKKVYLDGYGYASSFAGTLDGAGFTVSGLYYNTAAPVEGTYAYGLLPFVTADAVIKNVTVDKVSATVNGGGYIGAVAGAAHVMAEDFDVSPLHAVSFVGVNVADAGNIALLGGASRGVKFDLCTASTLYGNVSGKVITKNCNNSTPYRKGVYEYNTFNVDDAALAKIRNVLIGNSKDYIAALDTSTAETDICDLVAAKLGVDKADAGEKLVWSQEFGGSSIDKSIWTEGSMGMPTGTTLEHANTATFKDGVMSMNTYDTGKLDENGNKIYAISNGLSTQNSMSFKYGRLEMRAKVPYGAGAFPALWLVSRDVIGYDVMSEYSTEIDIFEVFGKTKDVNSMITCIHKWYNEDGVKKGDECSCGTAAKAGNGYKIEESDRDYQLTSYEFHDIVFEWTEDTMTFEVDGEVFFTATKKDMDESSSLDYSNLLQPKTVYGFDKEGYETSNDGIYNQFMSVILTNHMYSLGSGSAYKYEGAESEITANLDNLSFEIDYIRLYQNANGEINLK